MHARIAQQVHVAHLVENAAVFVGNGQAPRTVTVRADGTAKPHQEITQQMAFQIAGVAPDTGRHKVMIHVL